MEFENPFKSSFQLPNEIWLEIFKHFDTPSLLDLSLVCKHWNNLIFTHASHMIKLNFDLDQRKYPRKDIGMAPERYYKHLCLRSFKLNSPAYLLKIVQQLAVNLETMKLELVSLECSDLVQLLALCTRMNKLSIKAKYFECDDTLYGPRQVLPAVRCLSFDVQNYVSTFDRFSFETSFLQTMPNVQELETIVYSPLVLRVVVYMAPRLKILKATVYCDAINSFLSLQLPVLEVLDITLLQPEQQWRKRRTFHVRALQQFLLGCKVLKTAKLSFRCEYDQQLLTTIFTSLPRVEKLQLSGGLATERFTLNGIERMTHLKVLMLHCLLLFQEDERVMQMPTVEKFSLCTFIRPNKFVDILKRFPNLKSLSFRMYGDELQSITNVVPLLEELTVDISRITPNMLNQMQQLVTLKKLTIDAYTFARSNFRLLRNLLALPALKCLDIRTGSNIPDNIASLVAATNLACKLILNGQQVKPALKVRRTGVKRKSTAIVATSNKQSANESAASTKADESQPSGSGTSTSGCSSFLASSSTVTTNQSVPTISDESQPFGSSGGSSFLASSSDTSDVSVSMASDSVSNEKRALHVLNQCMNYGQLHGRMDDLTDVASTIEAKSSPSESGASTSGGGSFLASSSVTSNINFYTARCSSPSEKRAYLELDQIMNESVASGGMEESTDGAGSSAASTHEGSRY